MPPVFTAGASSDIQKTFNIDLLIQSLPENLRIVTHRMWERGDDWINYIKKKEIENYENGYVEQSCFYLLNDNVYLLRNRTITYMGYSENKWLNNIIIEKF